MPNKMTKNVTALRFNLEIYSAARYEVACKKTCFVSIVVLGGILKMRTEFFCFCLIATFALSIESAKAQQEQQPGIQPSQPQQQPQQQQQQGPQQPQQYAGAPAFDATLLQGQWETQCFPAVPGQWLIPSQYPPSPGNGQRGIYTFSGESITYQVTEYLDPFCDPNDAGPTPHTEMGTWHYFRSIPQYPGSAQIDFYFRTCSGVGCALNNINRLYGNSSQVFQFLRGPNQLFVGDVDPASAQVFTHFRHPLYRPGFAPEDPR